MKINNEIEERYTDVKNALETIGYKVPMGVNIMANIIGICEDITKGHSYKEICNTYGLKSPKSFTTTFKNVTGVSVTDIPKMTVKDRRRQKLIELNYGQEDIKRILELIDETEVKE